MDRVHYRRVTERGARPPESGGFREKLISQAIVSAVALALTLAACVFDSPYTAGAQRGLQNALEGYVTADALLSDLERAGRAWLAPETAPAETTQAQPTAQSMYRPEAEENLKSPGPAPSMIPGP